MKNWWTLVAVVALGESMLSAPVSAQTAAVLKTCSQAYGQCFDACASRHPGGGETSAKCIDKCAMARAQCDRSGCFKDEGVDVCGLAKQ